MYDISNQIFVLLYQRFWSFVLLVQEDGRASVGTAGAACCSIKDRTKYKKWGRPSIRRWSGPWREIQCGVSAASEGGNYATAKYASRQRKERRTLDTEDKHKYKYINNMQLVRMS